MIFKVKPELIHTHGKKRSGAVDTFDTSKECRQPKEVVVFDNHIHLSSLWKQGRATI